MKLFVGFRCSLRGGDPCAAKNIARVYSDRGNHSRAMLWYGRASACGDGDALVEVGRGYYKGVGVRPDPNYAVRCFRRAIASRNITQAGREDAMFQLGVAFHEGRGARKSNALAIKWLSRANINDDHAEAQNLIERAKQKKGTGHAS